jgi:hypothetical protein
LIHHALFIRNPHLKLREGGKFSTGILEIHRLALGRYTGTIQTIVRNLAV